MAALVCFVCGVGVQLFQIVRQCSASGWSVRTVIDTIKDTHNGILARQYLANIERIYGDPSCVSHSIGIECFNCRPSNMSHRQMWNEVEGYVQVDDAVEAFEVISHKSAVISEEQSRFICENRHEYHYERAVDIRLGTSFYISGTILKNCEGFAINLTLGHLHRDIALHVNPRLPQNYIVRNTKINGKWGKEEVTSSLPFTLKRGQRFAIQVLVTDDCYLLSLNGLHFTTYEHRIPYQKVTCIQVTGDICDVKLEQLPMQEYPERAEQRDLIHNIDRIESFNTNVLKNETELEMPFYGKLGSHFVPGSRLHVVARVKVLPHSFYLNLQQGQCIWPHPTIAFHLNPRFNTVGGKHVIIKNAWLDGHWDREERCEIHTDFMPSRTFHMIVVCTTDGYEVYLNDSVIAQYSHRIDSRAVDTVYIHGDIRLKHVSQEAPNSA